MIDEEKFNELLSKHKRLLIRLAKNLEEKEIKESFWLFKRLSQQSRELAIVSSGFKCEKCKSSENLTIHHLIMKKAKGYMPHNRWFTQRCYWANRVCLCIECHKKYHNFIDKVKNPEDDMKQIGEKRLKKLKEKWGHSNPKETKLKKKSEYPEEPIQVVKIK